MPRPRSWLPLALALGSACARTADPTAPPPPAPSIDEAALTALATSRGALSYDPYAELARLSAVTWRHGDLTLRPLTGAAILVELDLQIPVGDGALALLRVWGPRLTGPSPVAWDEHFGLGPDSPRCADAVSIACDAEGRVTVWREHGMQLTVRWRDGHPRELALPDGTPLVELGYDARGLQTLTRPGSGLPPTTFTRDDYGRLSAVIAPGQTTHYGYDGELLTAITRGDQITRLDWDERDRVTRLSGPGPLLTALSYPSPGVTELVDALGQTTRFTWLGTPTEATVEATPLATPERATRWRFSPDGRLLATSVSGLTTTFEWSTGGTPRLVAATFPGGLVQRLERDETGRLLAITEGDRKVGFTFSDAAAGTLSRLSTPDGDETFTWSDTPSGAPALAAITRGPHQTRFTRDPLGRPTLVESGGARDVLTFDPSTHLPATIADEHGATHHLSWDPLGRPLTHRRPDGATASWHHLPDGRLESATDFDGQTTRFRYDPDTQHLTRIDGPRGPITRSLDALGRLLTETSPLGTTRLTWRGPDLVRVDLPDGRHTTRDHDAFGRLVREASSDGATHTFTWEPPAQGGRLLSEALPDGRTRHYTWDEASRLTRLVEDGPAPNDHRALDFRHHAGAFTMTDTITGLSWLYRLDAGVPRLLSATSPGGASETLSYDDRGRLVARDSTRSGITRFEWDTLGRPARIVSGSSGTSTFAFDAASRLTEVRDPARALRFTWDSASRLLSASDGEHLWRLSYPPPERGLGPIALTDPAGRATRFTWDERGRLATRTLPWGATERYGYDDAGRLSEVTGPTHRTFGWDERGRPTRLVVDGVLARALSWDERGRLTSDRSPDQSDQITHDGLATTRLQARPGHPSTHTTRTRDAAGRTLEITLDASRLASYRYDELGRLDRVEGPAGFAIDFERDPVGRRKGLRLAGGGHVAYRFDDAHRLVGLEVRDTSGGVTRATFTWDTAGRLSASSLLGTTLDYRHAPSGRIAATLVDGHPEAYRFSPSGELLELGDRAIPHDPHGRPIGSGRAYDEAGRLISADGHALHYAAGRLSAVTTGDGELRYGYDGDGRLIARTGPTRERWVWDGDSLLLSQAGEGATALVRHVPGELPGERLGFVTAAGPRYLVQAPDGSTLLVLDGGGEVLAAHLFTPYGRPVLVRGPEPDPLAYRGRYRDPVTGLVHYPTRWYDPATGTFTSPDPEAGDAMDPSSLPRYAYLALDPVDHTDPDGAQAHEWGPETCLKAVCKLFQSGAIKPVWSVGDGYSYLGALEKRGWVYDVWARPVPGTDRVVTIFRDLNERASGYYGGGAGAFDNVVLDPDGPRSLRLPNSIRAATPASPAAPTTAVSSAAPQSGQPGLLSRAGASLREGVNNVRLGAQLYGRDVATTVAGLGGLSGVLGTQVGTIAVLPGGAFILGAAVAVAGALGYGVGTAVNQIPAVSSAAQSFISSLFGYQQDQALANLEAETKGEGSRARARRERRIRDALTRGDGPTGGDPTVAGGTVPLDGPPPGQSEGDEDNGEDEANTDEGGAPPEPPGDPTILDKVAAKKITVTFTHSTDASSGGIANIVECTETLTFWNVGSQAPGYGEATLRGRCVASLNGATHESGGSGTFSGGPHGTIIFSDGESAVSVRIIDGKAVELPEIGRRPLPAGAFDDWPQDLW